MSFKATLIKRIIDSRRCGELNESVVQVDRVAKVVKGGRRFGFRSLVVVGDGEGHVGFGSGKANEVPVAIQKGTEAAKNTIIKVPINGTTIPHDIYGEYGPTRVMMKPAKPGTGVIAGSACRAMIEAAGIKDIRTKVLGSNNPNNIVRATMNGLLNLVSPEQIAETRGVSLEEMGYAPF